MTYHGIDLDYDDVDNSTVLSKCCQYLYIAVYTILACSLHTNDCS